MYRTRKGTIERYREDIFSTAESAFKDHVIFTEQDSGPVKMWLCQKPGTYIYHFRIVSAPRMICVYGDVGDNVLTINTKDSVNWIKSSYKSINYVVEKISTSNKRENYLFFKDEAIELAKNELSKNKFEQLLDEYEFVDDFDAYTVFCNLFITFGGEAEFLCNVIDYEPSIYWTVACLKKFVELL